ncbi:MAG: UDP-glucose 4-epimerase GalE [Actinobacteria bacterium]|nr:UDP-glucose 4-epimerase GalE [Actinomycetota bacterium]MCG2800657.1 UDP-glucose 4-epimerase GalE [Cellulomonas sp.]
MTVMVTGGAGYIGSHVVTALLAAGRTVLVVDDLSTGRRESIPDVPLVRLDLADPDCVPELTDAARAHGVRAAVHLAAKKRVDESVALPLRYYEQNVGGLTHLLRALVAAQVRDVVFSSSAAVYGSTGPDPVTEQHPTAPVNPYGRTKLIGEWLLQDCARAHGLRTVALRYFNVAGAAQRRLADHGTGNLVTATVAALRRADAPQVFGNDYDTPDGTCVRDFVHVQDVAEAHLAALDGLASGTPPPPVLNVGTGRGTSVAQVVERLSDLAGRPGCARFEGRRAGDPPAVVACVDLIGDRLGWHARHSLDDMLLSAWQATSA